MLVLGGPAEAAELALKAPALKAPALKAPALKAGYDWTGFYVGGHFGYGGASFGPGTNPLPLQGVFFPHSPTGLLGGFPLGYNPPMGNSVLLGGRGGAAFPRREEGPPTTPTPS